MDHGARAQEQERFEEAVRQEVEHARVRRAGAGRGHHVAELRHRRVREDALDVVLHARQRRRQQGREGADPTDERQDVGDEGEERLRAGDHEHAGGDHRRGVDQRGHGRGPLHRLGEPHVGRLAHRAKVDQEHDRPETVDRQRVLLRLREERVELEGARRGPEHDDPDDEPEVAELGDPEGLHGRTRGGRPRVPVADQEVGAQAHQLPEHEHLDEGWGEDEPEHREREERLVGVVPPEGGRPLVAEVRERVELHEERDERDQHEHRVRERIHEQADRRHRTLVGRDPHPRRLVAEPLAPHDERAEERHGDRPDRDAARHSPGATQGGHDREEDEARERDTQDEEWQPDDRAHRVSLGAGRGGPLPPSAVRGRSR